MTPATLTVVIQAFIQSNDHMMRANGNVGPPMLQAFRGDQLIGMVNTRPAAPGHDGAVAVAELATFASAARADAVIVAWEHRDLAVFCGPTGTLAGPPNAIQILIGEQEGHRLLTYPFTATPQPGWPVAGTAVDIQWGEPFWHEHGSALPPVMYELLHFCWQPFAVAGADEHTAAVYLKSLGYGVDLVDLRK